LKSYQELIKDDKFDKEDSYLVDAKIPKMCWACEKKYQTGYMVRDVSKTRRIFFCKDCYDKLE
jgi:predicted SprT family Zn-dependent metalloprotease